MGLAEISEASRGVGRERIRVILSLLEEGKLVRERRGTRFVLARDVDEGELIELAREWPACAEADRGKLERMEAYARSARCRWRALHDYFGEEPPQLRGVCNDCRKGLAVRADPPETRAAVGG